MSASEIVLCSPVRTAIGTYNGSLKDVSATVLGAAVVRETLRRAGLAPDQVGSLIFGNVIQAGNKMNPARQAAIAGGPAGAASRLFARAGLGNPRCPSARGGSRRRQDPGSGHHRVGLHHDRRTARDGCPAAALGDVRGEIG
jgi:hypothetical protein